MKDNYLIYDPKNNLLLDYEGEILQHDVVIRTRRQIEKFKEISNKEVEKLTKMQVAGMIRHQYGFQGVRIDESYPVFKKINDLLDKIDISNPYKCKIMAIYMRLSTKQGILISPKKHCKVWMDLMLVPWLRLNSKSEVYRFKKALTDHNIARLGKERLVVNPMLGYNNTILFADTYLTFKDKIEIPRLAERYFDLGYDSILKTK